jgi:hypothetical protein
MKSSILSPGKSSIILTVAAAVAAGALNNQASAALTYDLRAISATGNAVVADQKTVNNARVGDVITFSLYAAVTGADGTVNTDGYFNSYFSILTSGGTNIVGNLGGTFAGNTATSGVTLDPVFNSTALAGAFGTDVNSDGKGTDVGSISTTASSAYIKPRSSAMNTNGSPITTGFGLSGTGQEFLLGTIKLTIVSVADTGVVSPLTVNFVKPTQNNIGGITNAATWQEDGVGKTAATGTVLSNIAVNISAVPEPSAFGMVMLGAIGLVGFRRFGLRRTA